MTDEDVLRLLAVGALEVLGRHPEASNVALLVRVTGGPDELLALYKPVRGERPLWDFPDGALAHREVAAFEISRSAGWDLVPPTVLREGAYGPGSLQQWIGRPPEVCPSPVAVTPPDELPGGYLPVLTAEAEDGRPLVVSHSSSPELRAMAVLDAVLNNSDRKGGHILLWEGRTYGIDHGVSLHEEPKLRTVLWGWAGDPLPESEVARLESLRRGLAEDAPLLEVLTDLLTMREINALRERCESLLRTGLHPDPGTDWPSVPWPPI